VAGSADLEAEPVDEVDAERVELSTAVGWSSMRRIDPFLRA
jgi:hypothetical protein